MITFDGKGNGRPEIMCLAHGRPPIKYQVRVLTVAGLFQSSRF